MMQRKLTDENFRRIAELNEQIDKAKDELVMIRVMAGLRIYPANLVQTKSVARLLHSYRCACGSSKRPGRVFCDSCYKSLPSGIQHRLSRMLKNSFVVLVMEVLHGLGHQFPNMPTRSAPTDAAAEQPAAATQTA